MNILAITPRYTPATGGAEYYLQEIAPRLIRDGHRVTVLTSNNLDIPYFWDKQARAVDAPDLEQLPTGEHIRRFPIQHLAGGPLMYRAWRRGIWLLSKFGLPPSWLHALARWTPHTPDLWRWIDQPDQRYDVILGLNICYEPFIDAARQLASRAHIPFLTIPFAHLGAGEAPGTDDVGSFYTMAHQNEVLIASDAIIAQTEAEAAFYRQRGAALVQVANPGIDIDSVRGGSAEQVRSEFGLSDLPIALMVGHQSADKGCIVTIQASKTLWDQGQRFHLVMAGSQAGDFADFLVEFGSHPHLHILGRVSDTAKLDLMAAADFFVMPSRVDSFGIVYLEAWANRLPVIGADAWAMRDMIRHEIDGLLVPFNQIEPLADAMARLLADPAERARLGHNGYQKVVDRFSWEAQYANFLDILEHVVKA